MVENLPEKVEDDEDDDGDDDQPSQILNIETLNYHGNDIRELARLAKISPDIAKKVIKQRDNANIRHHASYRFGMTASVVLIVSVLAAVAYLIVNSGILATLCAAVIILAVALMIRVVLTGKWSDTTWFGKLLHLIAKGLGSDTKDEE